MKYNNLVLADLFRQCRVVGHSTRDSKTTVNIYMFASHAPTSPRKHKTMMTLLPCLPELFSNMQSVREFCPTCRDMSATP